MAYEKFSSKIWKQNQTLVITIPAHIVKYCGWQEGDQLKIMATKKTEEEDKKNV